MARIAVLAVFAFGFASTALPPAALGAYGAKRAGCEVTKAAKDGWIAQNGLTFPAGETTTYAAQHPDEQDEPPGTYPLDIRRDGSLAGKVPWFRESSAQGELEVRGTRRPGGDRMRGRYDNHLGPESEVVPGALVFPRKGCWHITATSGDATLEATVWVIKRD
jgi:hypothetical protein